MVASLGARIIASLGGLVLALVAAPADFGVYGRVVLAVLTAGTCVFLRLDRAILSSESRADALAATLAALRVGLFLLPLCILAIYLAIPELSLGREFWLTGMTLAASLFAKSLLLISFTWLQRESLGVVLAIATIMQAVVQLTIQIALLQMPVSPMVSMLTGDAIGAAVGLFISFNYLRRQGTFSGDKSSWQRAIRQNWQLPALNMPATFASQATIALPLFAVAAHASAVETGAIAFAQRIFEPAFHLVAALATQFAVERNFFKHSALTAEERLVRITAYLLLGATLAIGLGIGAYSALAFGVPPKLATALQFAVPILAIAASIFASGPVMDLVQLAGRELLVFAVNLAALLAGMAIATIGGSSVSILWMFALLFAARAMVIILLWVTLRR